MSGAIATILNGKILKYCHHCKDYEWIGDDNKCPKCLMDINRSDWVSRLLYGDERWQELH